jgi:hypothetical protein
VRTGCCLCGAVSYRIAGEPVIVAHCYCRDCQRGSGAGHTTGAVFEASRIEIDGTLAEFRSTSAAGNTVSHRFCPQCGTRLFGSNTGMPRHMTVALGTLDEPESLTPEVAIFTRYRCRWDGLDPAVEAYDVQPDWKPPEPSG